MKFEEIKDLKLNTWTNVVVNTAIDEALEDVFLAIGYEDHGDHFLFIETKDGERYEYGWWCDRKYETSYEDLNESNKENKAYARLPHMIADFTKRERTSNELYKEIIWRLNDFTRRSSHYTDSSTLAQMHFDIAMEAIDKTHESNTFYNVEKYRKTILHFLEAEDIATPENLERLEKTPLSSRVDGSDGTAGKRLFISDYIDGDSSADFVFVDGKEVTIKDLAYKVLYEDDWGQPIYRLPLYQFHPEKLEQCKNTLKNSIELMKKRLDNLSKKVDSTNNFKDLYVLEEGLDQLM